jgi:hypothetical protein
VGYKLAKAVRSPLPLVQRGPRVPLVVAFAHHDTGVCEVKGSGTSAADPFCYFINS